MERVLGHGASAVVYLAHDLTHDRQVAAKVLRPELAESVGADRFLREIKVTARLQHPHIVSVLDAGNDGGMFFWVAPYLDGGTLRERLVRERQLTIGAAVSIAYSLATALDYAHQRGLVHRDVKPENVIFSGNEAYLGDFGIARALDGGAGGTTSPGIVRGTPAYMSPEQASGEREFDGRSDIYSLGCVLYEMLAGVPCFAGASAQSVIAQRLVFPPEPLRRYRPTVPDELADIVSHALALAPADRFQTARALADALAATGLALSNSTDAQRVGESRAHRGAAPVSWWARNRSRTLAAAVAALVVAVAATMRSSLFSAEGPRPMLAGDVLDLRVESRPGGAAAGGQPLSGLIADALRAELGAWPEVRVREPGDGGRTPMAVVTAIPVGDSARILVDVTWPTGGAPMSQHIAHVVSLDDARASRNVAMIAREVLGGPTFDIAPNAATMPGRSLTALRRYVSGWNELHAGRLDSAASLFRKAAQANPQFARALLWAAQSAAWNAPRDVRSWKADADAAVRSGTLTGPDSSLALALQAMSAKDYPSACRSFRSVTERDPTEFAGWFGLGECARLDTVILRGSSGVEFRSSHWAALSSYAEAVSRAPSSELLASVFGSVMLTSYASGNRSRNGTADGEPAAQFSALPSLDHDTLAFVPIPRADFYGLGPRAVPTTHASALRRGREVALDLTARWTRRFPRSSDAWFQRSLALELAGRIADGPAEVSAPAALDRADSAVTDEWTRAQIAVARTRLALRRLDFASAARSARAAIGGSVPRDARARAALAPLAALVGNVAKGDALWTNDGDRTVAALSAALADSLRGFRVRAVSGECKELEERRRALERAFVVAFAPAELSAQREQLLLPAYRDAVPCLGPSVIAEFAPTRPMDSVFHALAARDVPRARRLLASLRGNRAGVNIAAISWDHLYVESWALMQAGEGAVAREQLAAALGDLASMSGYTLSVTLQAAGLRRGLGLLVSTGAVDSPVPQLERWTARYAELRAAEPPSNARNP